MRESCKSVAGLTFSEADEVYGLRYETLEGHVSKLQAISNVQSIFDSNTAYK